jgi:lipopolysaccharide export system permease protein
MYKYFTVYDKYIFKQIFYATCVAILLFTIVWIAPEILLKVIKHIITGETTVKTGILILLCEIPKILGKAFPMGLLLGTLFTFDKLSKDSELTIFRATGMSFKRIIAPILVFSIIITVFCFITYDKLIPFSCQKLQAIKGEAALTQFIYTRKDENNYPKEAVIVSRFLNGKMHDVIVMDFDNQIYKDLHGLEKVMIAESGKKGVTNDGQPCWTLNNITVYNIDDNGIFHLVEKFKSVNILEGEP